MNLLQRALIEKAGNDHGFEYVLPSDEKDVNLASALHRVQVRIVSEESGFVLMFPSTGSHLLPIELTRTLPATAVSDEGFVAADLEALGILLRRAAELARALPNQAAVDFEAALATELAQFPAELVRSTEVERLVRQRVGQQTFRQAMLDYWGGACAVTGIAITEVLRASHAKPWAECASDAERLDVFNGFLLSANLDALFDRFLISFSTTGELLLSPTISQQERNRIGLNPSMHLRWLASEHNMYLTYHRRYFQEHGGGDAS